MIISYLYAYYCQGGENSTLDKAIDCSFQAKPGTKIDSKYIQSMKISECRGSFITLFLKTDLP